LPSILSWDLPIACLPDSRMIREDGYEGLTSLRCHLPGSFSEDIGAKIKAILAKSPQRRRGALGGRADGSLLLPARGRRPRVSAALLANGRERVGLSAGRGDQVHALGHEAAGPHLVSAARASFAHQVGSFSSQRGIRRRRLPYCATWCGRPETATRAAHGLDPGNARPDRRQETATVFGGRDRRLALDDSADSFFLRAFTMTDMLL